MPAPRRRDVLQLLMAGAAGLALPRSARAQQHPSSTHSAASAVTTGAKTELATSRLTESVFLVSGAGGNVLVVRGADGLVMINGGSAERSPELLKSIADQSGGLRVTALFNTDWHPNHTGSNDALA